MSEQRGIKFGAWDGTKMAELREVKYQVWDIEMKTMLTWEEVLDEVECEGIHLMLSMLRQDHYIMLQFTGLKDSKGVEVYYDDIYRDSRGYCRQVTEMTVAHWLIAEDKMNTPMESVEIIGNRFEHPELLEKAA